MAEKGEDKDGDKITMVNRRTGQLTERYRVFLPPNGTLVTWIRGTCERADFSGFPAKKF